MSLLYDRPEATGGLALTNTVIGDFWFAPKNKELRFPNVI